MTVRSLLEPPSPAVLTTDGSALVTPVWFPYRDGAFEVVIAERDVKLGRGRRSQIRGRTNDTAASCCVSPVSSGSGTYRPILPA